MVLGGIVFIYFIPRDPWPVGFFIYLYFCSIVGSAVGHILGKEDFKKFFISVCITSILFGLGIFFIDVTGEVSWVLAEYVMWMPLMLTTLILNASASTLTTFPIIGSLIGLSKKKIDP